MEHIGRNIACRGSALLVCIILLTTILGMTATPALGLITESFEGGTLGDWSAGFNYDPAFFDVSISSIVAFDGIYSVKMWAHGLPQPTYPRMTVWIERTVPAPPSSTLSVGITFQLYNENSSYAPEEVVAYLGTNRPFDYPDFVVIGMTQSNIGWKQFTYQTTVTTDPSGQIWAAIGFYNWIVDGRNYYFDAVNLTGVSEDFVPPTISNLRPSDSSIIGTKTPQIGADYFDASGIATSLVTLRVDSVNVTSLSTVTTSDVTYTPSPLSEGLHDVYLEVSDASDYHNKATTTWQFTVDTLPPLIANLDPLNQTTVSNNRSFIGASYSDASGINVSSVVLKVDTVDVTGSATVTATSIGYTPPTALSEGIHDVYLAVSDNSNPANRAVVTWWFTVDSKPPVITNLQPAASSTVSDNQPIIGASYSDASGILTSSVVLVVDGINVTSMAGVTATGVAYAPQSPLSEDTHSVYIEVKDASPGRLRAVMTWWFAIDSLAPTITNLRPVNGTTIAEDKPLIGANYFDASGIDTSSVVLTVDTVDVTASAVVTTSGISYTPTPPLPDGTHDVLLEVRDNSPNHLLSQATWSFTTDTTPPTSTLTVLTPQYLDIPNGRTFITSNTALNITATDSGIGTHSIWYLYYHDGETVPSYRLYSGEFSIPSSKSDGLIFVMHKGRDTLGNEEQPITVELYLDNTPPTSSIAGYDPVDTNYISNSLDTITIDTSDDVGSGIASVSYGIDDPSCPNSYGMPFVVGTVGEGLHRIYHKAIDRLGNVGEVTYVTIHLDTTPPVADAGADRQINPGDVVTFDGNGSTDGQDGSGIVNFTWTFVYQGQTITLYGVSPAMTLTERGTYEVTLTVEDRVGHTDTDTVTITFAPDTTTPGGVGGEFPWWVLLAIIIVIVALLGLYLLLVRKKKGDEHEEEEPPLKCVKCGHELAPGTMVCPECSTQVERDIE